MWSFCSRTHAHFSFQDDCFGFMVTVTLQTHYCEPGYSCRMTSSDCPDGSLCRDAPMPHCVGLCHLSFRLHLSIWLKELNKILCTKSYKSALSLIMVMKNDKYVIDLITHLYTYDTSKTVSLVLHVTTAVKTDHIGTGLHVHSCVCKRNELVNRAQDAD